MSTNSTISIDVTLNEEKIPDAIYWQAKEGGVDKPSAAKAFMLSIWDKNEAAALRIDLWTKQMMVDEMNDFFFQTLMTMADTYERATKQDLLAKELKNFAQGFKKKMDEELKKTNSLL